MEVLAPLDDIEDLLVDEPADLKSVFLGGVLQLFMLTQTLFEFCRRRPFLGTCVLAKPVMRILGSWLTDAAVQSSLVYDVKLMKNKFPHQIIFNFGLHLVGIMAVSRPYKLGRSIGLQLLMQL